MLGCVWVWRLPTLHTHVCAHRHTLRSSTPEAQLQLREWGSVWGCLLTGRASSSSTLPAQAASSRPGATSVQLSLILSLESQIPAVVWENKCAERAEYLMGPFSDRNDSGNEPPLSYGCQGLLLGWLAALRELRCQPVPAPCRGENEMPRAVWDAGGGRGGSMGLEMADAACPVSLHAHRYNACSLRGVMLSLGKCRFGGASLCGGGGIEHCSGVGRSKGQQGGSPTPPGVLLGSVPALRLSLLGRRAVRQGWEQGALVLDSPARGLATLALAPGSSWGILHSSGLWGRQ